MAYSFWRQDEQEEAVPRFLIERVPAAKDILKDPRYRPLLEQGELAKCVRMSMQKIMEGNHFHLNERVKVGKGDAGRKASASSKGANVTQLIERIALSNYPETEGSGGSQLSELLLSRSKALMKRLDDPMLDFKTVLRDLELAQNGVEETSCDMSDLLYLKGICQWKLDKGEDAAESMKAAMDLLGQQTKLTGTKLDDRKTKISKAMKTVEGNSKKKAIRPLEPKLTSEANPAYPSLSASATVSMFPNKGRGVIATKDIRPGDLILVEKLIIAQPDRRVKLVGCHHCLCFTYNPLPCPTCSDVLFCSVECRDEACSSYHKYECNIRLSRIVEGLGSQGGVNDMVESKLGFPLRVLFSHKLEDHWACFQQQQQQQQQRQQLDERSAEKPYLANDWSNFWALESSLEPEYKITTIHTMIPAATCLYLAKAAGYITTDEEEEKAALLLLRAVRIVDLNSFGMLDPTQEYRRYTAASQQQQQQRQQGRPVMAEFRHVGGGIGNTASLLNHSCIPNATQFTAANNFLLFASRTIKAGEEITISYGPHILEEDRRIQLYRSYYISSCHCNACENGWEANIAEGFQAWRIKQLSPGLVQKIDGVEAVLLQHRKLPELIQSSLVKQSEMLGQSVKSARDARMYELSAIFLITMVRTAFSLMYNMSMME